jgi:hypothetical protein
VRSMTSSPGAVEPLVLGPGFASRCTSGPSSEASSTYAWWARWFCARDWDEPPRRSGDELVSRDQFGRRGLQSYGSAFVSGLLLVAARSLAIGRLVHLDWVLVRCVVVGSDDDDDDDDDEVEAEVELWYVVVEEKV